MTEDKRQVTSSYVFCPPNPATSSQKWKSPENPDAGLAKRQLIYKLIVKILKILIDIYVMCLIYVFYVIDPST